MKKPSEHLADLLMGRVDWNDAAPAIQSWARFPIYQAAREILDMPDRAARRKALGKVPTKIRPMVEAEIMRLHGIKKTGH